ncbi:ABC transporter substrate-binding protein [Christiangramia aquimixticola]|uniref:ABC transporter substrate-binding protein n=1 Tax=Christiangramia aquimixticola TaxID=1697558 RepID=UPI003AA8E22B
MKSKILLFCLIIFCSCKDKDQQPVPSNMEGSEVIVSDAEGFKITEFEGYKILSVKSPWPQAKAPFKYLLKEKDIEVPGNIKFDQVINIPVESLVVTSTTHIPALEALGVENKLVGFPGTHYISSEITRDLIDTGEIKELGQNENINTEVLINLSPDVVIGFAINASNKGYETIQETGIPVLYNGDWTEKTPLGKAEWIKFFGVLLDKQKEADSIYGQIKSEYISAKKLAKSATEIPKVLSGSMFNDKWYLPHGNSWQAQFIKDANAHYIYENTEGDGSLALAFESVLEKSENVEIWISSGQYESYEQLFNESEHYKRFKAVKDQEVYSVSLTKGATGGILFYELGPQRPDIILKDLISIFHPDLLNNYQPVFYKPLQ